MSSFCPFCHRKYCINFCLILSNSIFAPVALSLINPLLVYWHVLISYFVFEKVDGVVDVLLVKSGLPREQPSIGCPIEAKPSITPIDK